MEMENAHLVLDDSEFRYFMSLSSFNVYWNNIWFFFFFSLLQGRLFCTFSHSLFNHQWFFSSVCIYNWETLILDSCLSGIVLVVWWNCSQNREKKNLPWFILLFKHNQLQKALCNNDKCSAMQVKPPKVIYPGLRNWDWRVGYSRGDNSFIYHS